MCEFVCMDVRVRVRAQKGVPCGLRSAWNHGGSVAGLQTLAEEQEHALVFQRLAVEDAGSILAAFREVSRRHRYFVSLSANKISACRSILQFSSTPPWPFLLLHRRWSPLRAWHCIVARPNRRSRLGLAWWSGPHSDALCMLLAQPHQGAAGSPTSAARHSCPCDANGIRFRFARSVQEDYQSPPVR